MLEVEIILSQAPKANTMEKVQRLNGSGLSIIKNTEPKI
jgi:hypothetical protein